MKQTALSLFKKGHVLHLDKFDFGKGGKLKGRLLVVLQDDRTGRGEIVIATVTSTFYCPDALKKPRCIKTDDGGFRCYLFPKQQVVCNNGYFFDLDSFVNLNASPDVFIRTLKYLQATYVDTNSVEPKDVLTEDEYHELVYCIFHSRHTPRGVKEQLNEELNEIAARNEKKGQ